MTEENKNNWSVYEHVFPNGKRYIGITSRKNAKERWGSNGVGYKIQPVMWRAIQKYGWNNIEHNVLYTELSIEEAAKLEKELIQKYETLCSQNGYNLSPGGDSCLGYQPTEETKRKIKENHADISGANHPRSQYVLCVELNYVFECIRDIQKYLGIKHVSCVCNGTRKRAGGYRWKYIEYDDIEPSMIIVNKNNIEEIKENMSIICQFCQSENVFLKYKQNRAGLYCKDCKRFLRHVGNQELYRIEQKLNVHNLSNVDRSVRMYIHNQCHEIRELLKKYYNRNYKILITNSEYFLYNDYNNVIEKTILENELHEIHQADISAK